MRELAVPAALEFLDGQSEVLRDPRPRLSPEVLRPDRDRVPVRRLDFALQGRDELILNLPAPVQTDRPFKWLNWESARLLDMIKGSYLFQDDPKRIIQGSPRDAT